MWNIRCFTENLFFQDHLIRWDVKFGIRAKFVHNFQTECDNSTLLKRRAMSGNRPIYITCEQLKNMATLRNFLIYAQVERRELKQDKIWKIMEHQS